MPANAATSDVAIELFPTGLQRKMVNVRIGEVAEAFGDLLAQSARGPGQLPGCRCR